MKEEKKTEKKISKTEDSVCSDKLCPFHGSEPLKTRGRIFEGKVIRKLHGRITLQFERMFYLSKYERYEKRKTKLHARLPNCLDKEINIGDVVKIAETRPISKTIHFVALKKISGGEK